MLRVCYNRIWSVEGETYVLSLTHSGYIYTYYRGYCSDSLDLQGFPRTYSVDEPDVIPTFFHYIPQFWIRYRLVVYEDSATNPLPVPLSTGYI